ncbi:Hypothetical protein, putative [Bodo saltans]|uniref:Ubiquitin-like domain-containing protein n=1 Tax=Bodo saltans TaxID=75058 RepID=A0A0S4JEL7_BODSA|nr:Hypothetical protein, putative [Bodo saltans]|eukprot:CUG86817.1 Hypothetical protein, putative [Bodo saltans]
MHLKVVTDRGETHKVSIDEKTRVGQVLEQVAHKVSRKPNLLEASLTYNGALLPLDMRACALPAGATIAFQMAHHEASLANTTMDTSFRAAIATKNTLLIQLPNSTESRRVHVNSGDPVSCLREVLAIPQSLLIHYNKRPILDESRSIASLRMTDKYLITFAAYQDTSYLTATSPFASAAPRGVVKPPSQMTSYHLSELKSPKRGDREEVSFQGTSFNNASKNKPLPTPLERSAFEDYPQQQVDRSISFHPPAPGMYSPERSRVPSRLGRTTDRSGAPPVVRGDLFGSAIRNTREEEFSDLRPVQAQSVSASPAPSWNRSPPRQQVVITSTSTSSAVHTKSIRIYVSDPEDGGFTHDLEVNPERKVASLHQFVEHPEAYSLYCDTQLVSDPEHTTFWDATGGKHGSLFTFEQRRDSRMSRYH